MAISTAPVNDVLAEMENRLPKAKSRWELAGWFPSEFAISARRSRGAKLLILSQIIAKLLPLCRFLENL
jgi:hypothetical protein